MKKKKQSEQSSERAKILKYILVNTYVAPYKCEDDLIRKNPQFSSQNAPQCS